MDERQSTEGDAGEPRAPAGLERDLARWLGGPAAPPHEVDRRILEAVGAELGRQRGRPPIRRSWWPLAAAAAALIALGLWRVFAPAGPAMQPFAAADIDRSGRVDVLDAFTLARELKRSVTQPSPAIPWAWDVDGDGRVDTSDVDAIVAEAVRIHS